MSLATWFVADRLGLPKRKSGIRRERNIRVRMPDGVELATDHYAPKLKGQHPTLLMRVPYGRSGFSTIGEIYAERGYHVVLQACRGTDVSGGEFDPLSHEREDGLATLDWIKAQPWFDGRLGTTGPSYLGYAQWAICDALPKQAAMAVKVSSAEFKSIVFPGGGFQLGLWLSWLQIIEGIKRNALLMTQQIASGGIEKKTLAATMQLPLIDADNRVTGHDVPFWERWMHEAVGNDAFWVPMDHTHRLTPRTPPVHFVSGWYDFMLDQLLRDYHTLVDLGHTPYLTIGPWFHVSGELQSMSASITLDWMNAKLLGEDKLRDKPVRVYLSGRNEWREFDAWPPSPADDQIWHIHPDRVLSQRPVRASEPERYRYDPADPTPAIGGAMFAFTGAGPVDNAKLESRKDVLTYTSEPLFNDTTVIGNIGIVLFARSSLPTTDFFVRLSDVDPSGKSINVADGYIRRTSADAPDADGIWKIGFRMHSTAHTFLRDHRLRILVASGAHPRYARNTGTEEPLGEATTLHAADIEIFHDPRHPSAIHLPVQEKL